MDYQTPYVLTTAGIVTLQVLGLDLLQNTNHPSEQEQDIVCVGVDGFLKLSADNADVVHHWRAQNPPGFLVSRLLRGIWRASTAEVRCQSRPGPANAIFLSSTCDGTLKFHMRITTNQLSKNKYYLSIIIYIYIF